jgi:hypothetical protein
LTSSSTAETVGGTATGARVSRSESEELNERALRARDRLLDLLRDDPRFEMVDVVPARPGTRPVVRVHLVGGAEEVRDVRVPSAVEGIEVVVVGHGDRARPQPEEGGQ